ncbi:MAG: RDD family protein [Campylobacteraceae bacterium]|nr:RDD family protein [Campylobacteraceae bacterium]
MTEEELVENFERENITLASISARTKAFVIDEVLVSLLFVLAYWSQFSQSEDIEQTMIIMNSMVVYAVGIKIIYQSLFVWMYGATLGKMAVKIRVIYIYDLANPGAFQSALRSVVRVFSESFFYLGFIWAMLNPKRETWHDKVARTLVINA